MQGRKKRKAQICEKSLLLFEQKPKAGQIISFSVKKIPHIPIPVHLQNIEKGR